MLLEIPKEFLEKIPGEIHEIPGVNPHRYSWRKTPNEFSENIPEGISGKNLFSNFSMKSSEKFLDEIPQGKYWTKSSEKMLLKIHLRVLGGYSRRTAWRRSPEEKYLWIKSQVESWRKSPEKFLLANLQRNTWRKSPDTPSEKIFEAFLGDNLLCYWNFRQNSRRNCYEKYNEKFLGGNRHRKCPDKLSLKIP